MTNRVAESIRRGLEEAIAYVQGNAELSLYDVHEESVARGIRRKNRMVKLRRPGRCPLESRSGDKP